MADTQIKEPVIRYDLYPNLGIPVDDIKCIHCGFNNIIACPQPGPKKRLNSPMCMHCGKRLTCFECGNELIEGLITNFDSVLFCSNSDCGLWFLIW